MCRNGVAGMCHATWAKETSLNVPDWQAWNSVGILEGRFAECGGLADDMKNHSEKPQKAGCLRLGSRTTRALFAHQLHHSALPPHRLVFCGLDDYLSKSVAFSPFCSSSPFFLSPANVERKCVSIRRGWTERGWNGVGIIGGRLLAHPSILAPPA